MILTLLAIGAGVIGLSGAARTSSAKGRLERAVSLYRSLLHESDELKAHMGSQLTEIGRNVEQSMKKLKIANRILAPLERHNNPSIPKSLEGSSAVLSVLNQSNVVVSGYSTMVAAGLGLGVGSTLAAGSWAAASVLGTASTGTAIATLHGAAATNATLAFFGHGSLAAGGAGIAGGQLALISIVALPAAALMGFAAHAKASEINEKAEEIKCVNQKNTVAITAMRQRLGQLRQISPVIAHESSALSMAVAEAEKALFRYGWLSRAFKRLRYSIKGRYYTREEMIQVERLANAVDQFISAMHASASVGGTGQPNSHKALPQPSSH